MKLKDNKSLVTLLLFSPLFANYLYNFFIVDKFYVKGNKAAAVRIRKSMQEVKNLAQELRIHVQETKNSL